jgi:hypothetical protein
MIETFMRGSGATLIWAPPRRASTPHKCGEGLEQIGDEAASRRVGQLTPGEALWIATG